VTSRRVTLYSHQATAFFDTCRQFPVPRGGTEKTAALVSRTPAEARTGYQSKQVHGAICRGSSKISFPDFTHRLPLPPTHFCQRTCPSRNHSVVGRPHVPGTLPATPTRPQHSSTPVVNSPYLVEGLRKPQPLYPEPRQRHEPGFYQNSSTVLSVGVSRS
jgi:hypothetical protein